METDDHDIKAPPAPRRDDAVADVGGVQPSSRARRDDNIRLARLIDRVNRLPLHGDIRGTVLTGLAMSAVTEDLRTRDLLAALLEDAGYRGPDTGGAAAADETLDAKRRAH